MKIPIQAALSFPDRIGGDAERIDLASIGSLDFEPVDRQKFPALDLAYEVGRKAATYPAVLNAANEIAVEAFLDGRLRFTDITRVIEETLSTHDPLDATDLGSVLEADAWARSEAVRLVNAAPVAGSPAGSTR